MSKHNKVKAISEKHLKLSIGLISDAMLDTRTPKEVKEKLRLSLHYLNLPIGRPVREFSVGDHVAASIVVARLTNKTYRIKCIGCGRERSIGLTQLQRMGKHKPKFCAYCNRQQRLDAIKQVTILASGELKTDSQFPESVMKVSRVKINEVTK